MNTEDRLARLRQLPKDWPIGSHQLWRLLGTGVWRSNQVRDYLATRCEVIEAPRHAGDRMGESLRGLAGLYRAGDVLEALEADAPEFLTGEPWLAEHQYQTAMAAPSG
jgi:hypothetical protein